MSISLDNFLHVMIMLLLLISDDTPSTEALSSAKQLLQDGVAQGFISPEFALLGHRDKGQTDCPGAKLYAALPQLKGSK